MSWSLLNLFLSSRTVAVLLPLSTVTLETPSTLASADCTFPGQLPHVMPVTARTTVSAFASAAIGLAVISLSPPHEVSAAPERAATPHASAIVFSVFIILNFNCCIKIQFFENDLEKRLVEWLFFGYEWEFVKIETFYCTDYLISYLGIFQLVNYQNKI